MQSLNHSWKEWVGAILLIAMGLGVMAAGYSYDLGTPRHMGPGLVPFALGAAMAIVGLLIGMTARGGVQRAIPRSHGHDGEKAGAEWRGWLCILGGVVSFVILGQYGGLVPASFVAVLVSALGDRETTLKESLALAAVMTVSGVVIFHYALQLQLPLFQWG